MLPSPNGERSIDVGRLFRTVTGEVARSSWRRPSLPAPLRHMVYRRSCCEFMLLIPWFAVFMMANFSHMSLTNVYVMEKTINHELVERQFGNHSYTITAIHDAAVFWEWFTTALMPVVIVQKDQLGHTLPRSDWGYVVSYNAVVGGIRLAQVRSAKVECKHSPGFDCYPEQSVDHRPFGYPPCDVGVNSTAEYVCFQPSLYKGYVDIENNEGFSIDDFTGYYEMWLDCMEPEAVLGKRVQYLADRHWIDQQTKSVTVELLLMNRQYEPLLVEALLKFDIDRTGYIREELHVETIPADPYSSNYLEKIGLEIAYLGILLVNFGSLAATGLKDYRRNRNCVHTFRVTVMSNIVEIICIAVALVMALLWWQYVPLARKCWSDINALKRPTAERVHNSTDYQLWQDYHHELAQIEENVKLAIEELTWIHRVSVITLVGLLIRCFKVWEGIPAMSSVLVTLRLAGGRLTALLVSAGTLFFLYAGAGMLVFGTHLKEFNTMDAALRETALVVLNADPDVYREQSEIDPLYAALWFWTLVAIMFVVVLNMALGILVDAAMHASNTDKDKSITLVEQTRLTVAHYIGYLAKPFKHSLDKKETYDSDTPDTVTPDMEFGASDLSLDIDNKSMSATSESQPRMLNDVCNRGGELQIERSDTVVDNEGELPEPLSVRWEQPPWWRPRSEFSASDS